MSFVIFGDVFTFPEGNAATNRVYTYANGFKENGITVHVVCFANEYLSVYDGVIDGINYYHPFGQQKRSEYFIIRSYLKLLKFFKTIKLLNRINKEDKIIAINIASMLFLTHILGWICAKIFKTKLILECNEHPFCDYRKGFFKKTEGALKFFFESKLYDGVFCISSYLIDFYLKRGVNQRKLFLVPSTVDTARFKGISVSPLSFKYILYCGSLTILKDGVDILIKSFTRISSIYPEINLVLIGKGDSFEEERILNELVTTLKIDDRVFFLGQLPRKSIVPYLCNAEILALARPKSIIADAGFPSKLTEYLATGNPVVVTEVGEIPLYLKDNENAFISKPDSVEAFADKLEYVLGNYEFARQIGSKGKELTAKVFNYNYQAKQMLQFIASLN